MSTISVQEISQDPIAFVRRIEAGEAFIIVRDECPLAEIRPLFPAGAVPRPYGLAAGRFTVPADFDRPLPDDSLGEFDGE